ncbi:RNA-binding protein 7-like isoform X1 [Stegostoma tigrinum]|uniref:RNA-binding protein 7-like isoform X1 n=1 Tax=Stegostoma tigrinum TaxID=3053191 RepID=UPI00202AD884|nr:RNA-binding protein 7-like isoform X1 [Stegostoma tigrinum]XP_048418382.1 RNA-binding protein 7-like isoform X1 [Stegostoma tigrinum]XP_048418383.1 RNA-binding protein 7-like isoform X1 [Stegostoma tigrinum]XP_048418384.1 RNA-binding protein 7-like isoform X1 [Stegostoma tigrinum]XP_048418385.1 RNA-binding protein 7-like isoform X1 [Stegostoma tigrinum]
MGVSNDADKMLFIGNLDQRVTEELLFELFLQSGPLLGVKIPKDKDGKSKQYAFVHFKHVESVHYGKNLLNGIQLYGKAIKIQFRSGSVHETREGNQSQNSAASFTPPYNSNQFSNNRFGHGMDNMGSSIFATPQPVQKSFCSPDSLQRQVVVNNMWQQARGGQQNYSLQQANANNRSTLQQSYRGTSSNQQATPQNYSTPSQPRSSSPNSRMMWHSEKSTSNTQRQQSYSSYRSDNGYFTRDAHFQDHNSEQYYRGNREPELQHDQSSQHNRRWEYDYRREHSRSNRRRNW